MSLHYPFNVNFLETLISFFSSLKLNNRRTVLRNICVLSSSFSYRDGRSEKFSVTNPEELSTLPGLWLEDRDLWRVSNIETDIFFWTDIHLATRSRSRGAFVRDPLAFCILQDIVAQLQRQRVPKSDLGEED